MRLRLTILLGTIAASTLAHGDILSAPESGWIPEYQQLITKFGYQYFRTNTNFDESGALVDPKVGGQAVTLVENRFRLGAEYGIAQDWAFAAKLGFNSASAATAAGTAGSGSGLSDAELSLKWNVKVMDPILTFDVFTHIPLASTAARAGDVVVTDGSTDIGIRLFTGHRAGKLLFSLAPAFVYRTKDYSPLFTVDGLVRFDFLKGYVQGVGNFTYAIDNGRVPFYSAPNKPDALGAAGSFARLNGAPTGFSLGAGLGVKVYEEWTLEASLNHAIYGVRYPSFLSVYAGVRTMFDFFTPIKPKRVKEVPFEEDDSKR